MARNFFLSLMSILTSLCGVVGAADGNRLTYLDDPCNPYYVSLSMPKLSTPQWVGEAGIDAVITLGIDDMRDPEVYEPFLRPILNRLKQIDGRAALSIMTCSVDPQHPRLQQWIKEGVSLETHTADHPCPCLQKGDFDRAKATYDRCVDQLAAVPNSRPVAFRFPCMDSLNTPSPRAFAEIVNRTTPAGNFLQISTSVCMVHTADDPALARDTVFDSDGRPRFGKYVPFQSFVNKVENYPYPFVVGRLCWEFPCSVPDDWQGQQLQGPNNPATVEDMKAVIDATVAKQGIANIVFHPHGWIRNDQLVSVIDYAAQEYGSRIKFLNFRECLERLNEHLLAGQPLRAANGQDNGVRLLDVDADGYLDVVIANEQMRRTRIWSPERRAWRDIDFPAAIVHAADDGSRTDGGVRFGVLRKTGMPSMLVANESEHGIWHFDGRNWIRDRSMENGLAIDGQPLLAARDNVDQGVRLRDIDGDRQCEIIIANPSRSIVLEWNSDDGSWRPAASGFPDAPIVDHQGRDAGLRFVDLDQDGYEDIVFSNEERYAVYRYDPALKNWGQPVRSGSRSDSATVPMIVRNGTNNGAWFSAGQMWIQNEDTDRLPDGIDRRPFADLLR